VEGDYDNRIWQVLPSIINKEEDTETCNTLTTSMN